MPRGERAGRTASATSLDVSVPAVQRVLSAIHGDGARRHAHPDARDAHARAAALGLHLVDGASGGVPGKHGTPLGEPTAGARRGGPIRARAAARPTSSSGSRPNNRAMSRQLKAKTGLQYLRGERWGERSGTLASLAWVGGTHAHLLF
jgi:hypothetical protein